MSPLKDDWEQLEWLSESRQNYRAGTWIRTGHSASHPSTDPTRWPLNISKVPVPLTLDPSLYIYMRTNTYALSIMYGSTAKVKAPKDGLSVNSNLITITLCPQEIFTPGTSVHSYMVDFYSLRRHRLTGIEIPIISMRWASEIPIHIRRRHRLVNRGTGAPGVGRWWG